MSTSVHGSLHAAQSPRGTRRAALAVALALALALTPLVAARAPRAPLPAHTAGGTIALTSTTPPNVPCSGIPSPC